MNLFESGGKFILGVNTVQASPNDVIRALRQYHPHIQLVDGGKHWRIHSRDGRLLHAFTKGTNLGPKSIMGTLSAARAELERVGQYQRQKGESGTSYIQKRQNVEVADNQEESNVDPKELLQQKISKYIELVKKPSMGQGKRTRLTRAIGRLKERIKERLSGQ